MHKLKSMFFPNRHCSLSHMSGIYLESWFSWLWGGVQKTLNKRRKQIVEKHCKVKRKKNRGVIILNEEYEESQITTIYIYGFKLYFARKHNLKKSYLCHQTSFTVFMCCGISGTQ